LLVVHADSYVHGFSQRETERLYDQAGSVRDLFHHDTRYPAGSTVLEAGCGVGAQTVTLAGNSPDARIVAIDRAPQSLWLARALVKEQGLSNVQFQQADIFALPFCAETFDHVFVCHVLEHLADPNGGLQMLRRVLRKGGTMTVIEGDHGSCYFHPRSRAAQRAWNCLIEAQARLGGNSLIGRQLFPLLSQAGLRDIQVSPRMVYADTSKPDLMVAFVRKTIIPMVEGVRAPALDMQLIDEASWNKGIEDLHNVAECGAGSFCYTFFKGVGVR
jgi:SAM-dependent methyltransferase